MRFEALPRRLRGDGVFRLLDDVSQLWTGWIIPSRGNPHNCYNYSILLLDRQRRSAKPCGKQSLDDL